MWPEIIITLFALNLLAVSVQLRAHFYYRKKLMRQVEEYVRTRMDGHTAFLLGVGMLMERQRWLRAVHTGEWDEVLSEL